MRRSPGEMARFKFRRILIECTTVNQATKDSTSIDQSYFLIHPEGRWGLLIFLDQSISVLRGIWWIGGVLQRPWPVDFLRGHSWRDSTVSNFVKMYPEYSNDQTINLFFDCSLGNFHKNWDDVMFPVINHISRGLTGLILLQSSSRR